jgi:hypothetical protein
MQAVYRNPEAYSDFNAKMLEIEKQQALMAKLERERDALINKLPQLDEKRAALAKKQAEKHVLEKKRDALLSSACEDPVLKQKKLDLAKKQDELRKLELLQKKQLELQ